MNPGGSLMAAVALGAGTVAAGGAVDAASLLDDPAELATFTRWAARSAGGARGMAESSLRIGGMHCAACSAIVEQALRREAGVLEASVGAAAQVATVRWDPALTRISALVRAVESAGYSALPDTAAGARALRRSESRAALWRLFVAGLCSMQIMMLAAPAYLGAAGDLAPEHKRLLDWGSWLLTLPVLFFSAAPFFAGAWASLRRRRIGMDVPVAIGIAVAFVASSGAAWHPGGIFGSEVYFDSLTMFIAFLLGGRLLELRARQRAEGSLEQATGALPRTALRVRADGAVETVPVRALQPGDRVRVPVGEAYPADGLLLEGSTRADEALLTGESGPVARSPGDPVVAGSVNLGAPVLMRVDRVGADTRYEAIVALMRAARSQRPALLAGADRWAGPFVWAVLLAAAAAAAVWSVVDPARAVWVAVSVLIVTCPCALSLAAPSALLSAAGAMGRRGLLLRRLDAVEGLARMQTLFIDKTGTLTEGGLRCTAALALDAGGSPAAVDRLAGIAASLAGWSTHPASRAVREAFEPVDTGWRELTERAGQGLEALDADGRRWRLGAAAWAGDAGALPGGAARTVLGCDGVARVGFVIEERLRADAQAAVQALQRDGVELRLLSGDADDRARAVARALGLACPAGRMTPEDKLAALREAQARGERVGMLGDGVNDAPVLAQADVSIAMGEGALVARAQADAVLLSNRLGDLVRARVLARRALRVVHQNLVWAAAYNAACVPLALAGWMPPWLAGLGMAASSLVVVLNSLRLAR